jgi:protein SCO1/2
VTNYAGSGVVKEIKVGERIMVIRHEAISNYMDAMTMPFKVKEEAAFDGLTPGDRIDFQLHITDNESWIDHVKKVAGTGESQAGAAAPNGTDTSRDAVSVMSSNAVPGGAHSKNPLRFFKFTNQLNQPVSLADFQGQAIALTFFFTRCPIPEFCPRLSRNFQEVQRKMAAMPNAPTNWHLISITFDPRNDTPEVLKAYGEQYHADAGHWSFLTGPPDKIAELAKLCDVKFDADEAFYNHNFRTMIIDAGNRLQMVFPTSGDLSDSIVQELVKAAAAETKSRIHD